MKKWILIENINGDYFETILKAETREKALEKARDLLNSLTEYDLQKRKEIFIGCAEIEDGIINYDTMTNIIDIK